MERRPKSKFVTAQTCLLAGMLDTLAAILININSLSNHIQVIAEMAKTIQPM